jgi:hypothetical protein
MRQRNLAAVVNADIAGGEWLEKNVLPADVVLGGRGEEEASWIAGQERTGNLGGRCRLILALPAEFKCAGQVATVKKPIGFTDEEFAMGHGSILTEWSFLHDRRCVP